MLASRPTAASHAGRPNNTMLQLALISGLECVHPDRKQCNWRHLWEPTLQVRPDKGDAGLLKDAPKRRVSSVLKLEVA